VHLKGSRPVRTVQLHCGMMRKPSVEGGETRPGSENKKAPRRALSAGPLGLSAKPTKPTRRIASVPPAGSGVKGGQLGRVCQHDGRSPLPAGGPVQTPLVTAWGSEYRY